MCRRKGRSNLISKHRLGVYCSDLNLTNGGVAPYISRTLNALYDCVPKHTQVEIYTNSDTLPGVQFPQYRTSDYRRNLKNPQNGEIENSFSSQLDDLLLERKPDLLHVPYQACPPTYSTRIPFIVTLHDVQELHFPEFFSPEERLRRFSNNLNAVKTAAGIVVSFDHVKKDLVRFFACPEEKVFVVPPPYLQSEIEETNTLDHCVHLLPQNRYLLYPAQTWIHKNHLRLIEAFEQFSDSTSEVFSLVCTGRKNPDYFPVIEHRVSESRYRDRIVFTGLVDESELYWLYRKAAGVVIPTLYEAGSFPLVEAMFLQTPVICSNVTSLPQTIGNDRFVFDPLDVEEITRKTYSIALDQDFIAANLANSKRQVDLLKQYDFGNEILRVWNKLLMKLPQLVKDRQVQDFIENRDVRTKILAGRLRRSEKRLAEIESSWSYRVGYSLLHPWRIICNLLGLINSDSP